MKKALIAILLSIIANSIASSSALACTGYAVYSDTAYYGMNFDYPDVPISFGIFDDNGTKIFHMDFKNGDYFVPTVGMNNEGMFASCQMLYPAGEIVNTPDENELSISEAFINSLTRQSVDINNLVKDKILVNQYLTLHTLIADSSGNAMVLEAGKDGNLISGIDSKSFMVMTNFPNASIAKGAEKDVSGVGSDRYRTAYEYIEQNIDSFDYDKAFSVLEATIQKSGYPTQSSMVFIPDKSEVYIAIKRDFNKVWKVDIEKGTLEAYSGFDQAYSFNLSEGDIMMDSLISPTEGVKNAAATAASAFRLNNTVDRNIIIYIVGAAVLLIASVTFCFIIYRRKRQKNNAGR